MPGTKAGSVGPQNDRLRALLGSFRNVFLITGHLHRGFNAFTYEMHDGIRCVSIPALGLRNKDSVYAQTGLGFWLEVYADRVRFRARDFAQGAFLPEADKCFDLE